MSCVANQPTETPLRRPPFTLTSWLAFEPLLFSPHWHLTSPTPSCYNSIAPSVIPALHDPPQLYLKSAPTPNGNLDILSPWRLLYTPNSCKMSLPAEVRAQYVAVIDSLLLDADLTTVSVKQVRNGIQDKVQYDITPHKVRATLL